jgi:hypothetical protein
MTFLRYFIAFHISKGKIEKTNNHAFSSQTAYRTNSPSLPGKGRINIMTYITAKQAEFQQFIRKKNGSIVYAKVAIGLTTFNMHVGNKDKGGYVSCKIQQKIFYSKRRRYAV